MWYTTIRGMKWCGIVGMQMWYAADAGGAATIGGNMPPQVKILPTLLSPAPIRHSASYFQSAGTKFCAPLPYNSTWQRPLLRR